MDWTSARGQWVATGHFEVNMEEKDTAPKTAGIPPAAPENPLGMLQFAKPDVNDLDAIVAINEAALEVVRYHSVKEGQPVRYTALEEAAADFLAAIVLNAPPGPERSTAINHARTAKMWASCAISTER